MSCRPSQLEESNRTLTVDVANLASEKEELNNQLKEMQQRESVGAARKHDCILFMNKLFMNRCGETLADIESVLHCLSHRAAEGEGRGEEDELCETVL